MLNINRKDYQALSSIANTKANNGFNSQTNNNCMQSRANKNSRWRVKEAGIATPIFSFY